MLGGAVRISTMKYGPPNIPGSTPGILAKKFNIMITKIIVAILLMIMLILLGLGAMIESKRGDKSFATVYSIAGRLVGLVFGFVLASLIL